MNSTLLQRFRQLPLRTQLFAGVLLAQMLLVTTLAYALLKSQHHFLREGALQQTGNLAASLAASATPWLMAKDVAGLQEVIESVGASPDVAYAMVLGRDGKVLAHTRPGLIGQYVSDPASSDALRAAPASLTIHSSDRLTDVMTAIRHETRVLGWARIGLNNRILNEGLQTGKQTAIIFFLFALALGAAINLLLWRTLSGGFTALLGGLERLQAGERHFRLEERGDNEIARLCRGFNTMLTSLEWNESDLERHARQLELERSRLGSILDGARLGTWEWRVQDGSIVFNERWAAMHGYTLAELQPTTLDTCTRLTHPDDLPRSQALLEAHFAGKTAFYECELRVRQRDGSWRWVLDRGQVISRSPDGLPDLMAGTYLDIGQRKADEAELLRYRDQLQLMHT